MRKQKIFFILSLFTACCLLSASLWADGKFYSTEKVPPDLPYQRAVISYHNGQELLILQSRFHGEGRDFGWVVPLPNSPKLGTIKERDAGFFFWGLEKATGPVIIEGKVVLWKAAGLILLLLIIIVLAGRVYYKTKRQPLPRFFQGGLLPISLVLLLFFVVSMMAVPNLLSSRTSEGALVLGEETIGVYDIKIIKAAAGAKELLNWFNAHQYKFTTEDEQVLNNYISKNWCFVTARINPKELAQQQFRSGKGLVNPLVLLFPAREPVYPLALTAAAGTETEVLLYVIGAHKMAADNRFTTEFAGEIGRISWEDLKIESSENLKNYLKGFSAEGLIRPASAERRSPYSIGPDGANPGIYATKLRGRLSADEMKQDLVLRQAPDDKRYRQRTWRW